MNLENILFVEFVIIKRWGAGKWVNMSSNDNSNATFAKKLSYLQSKRLLKL